MRIVRKEKKNKKQKQKQRIEHKKIYNPWKVRSKKYSEYPYIVTVSFFRKNVFLSASDFRGRIKVWTNAGRLGFKGADKTQYMAVVAIAQKFFKKLRRYGIRKIFLKFKNYKRPRHAIKKALRKLRIMTRSYRNRYRKCWTTKIIKKNGKKLKGRVKFSKGAKGYKRSKRYKRGGVNVKILGIWTELHVSFNGCRNKKQRRKRHRRRAKRIRLK